MKTEKNETGTSLQVKKDRRLLRHGSYSIVLTVLVIAAVLILNLVIGQLPAQYTQIDLSGQQLSVLTDTTKEVLDDLSEEITLYYIVQDSDKDSNVSRLLERYKDYSSHVKLVEKDPVLNPQFTSQYTEETVTDNSVIVVCGDRNRVILYDEMYEYEFDYSYYSYTTTGFDAEGQITSAIAALTTDGLPKLYTLTGHGELELTSTLDQEIEKENIEMEELNLLTADAVPKDADVLLIASPTSDLSETEAQKVINYLRRGGSAILITDYLGMDLPNFDRILAYYGVQLTDGVVMEGDSNYFIQIPYYLVPTINSTEVSSQMTDGSAYVLLAAAQGIAPTEEGREDLTITEILTTSNHSYSKTDVEHMETYEEESGDIDGPFDIGVLITEEAELTDALLEETSSAEADPDLDVWLDGLMEEETGTEEDSEAESEAETEESSEEASEQEEEILVKVDDTETETETETAAAADTATTKVAVFTSSTIIDDTANSMVSGGNYQLFLNTLSWACDQESSVSVPSKSMTVDSLMLTAASSNFWSIVTIVIIPGILLIAGLGIWLSRRRR